jgi:ABC-type lipoprotein release transport system permease subunit
MFGLALRDALHHWRESRSVILHIAIGIGLFVVALSFVGTISTNANRLLFGTIGSTWLIEPHTRDDALIVDDRVLEQFANETGVDGVRRRVESTANASNPVAGIDRPESASVSLVGVDLYAEPALAKNFGVDATALDDQAVVVHQRVANHLNLEIGDYLTVSLAASATTFRVGAIVVPQNPNFLLSSWVLVNRSDLAESLYGDPDRITKLLIDAPSDAVVEIKAGLAGLDTAVTLSLWSDTPWSALMLGPQIWGALLMIVSTFTFIVICVGLASLVYSAMLARVRDFAVLKTAGMSNGSLHRMYMAEVVAQYIVGFVVGVLFALAAVAIINAIAPGSESEAFAFAVGSTALELSPKWWSIAAPFGIGIVLTIAILWFPIRAACARPVLDLLELR